jgi:hypothetical protein
MLMGRGPVKGGGGEPGNFNNWGSILCSLIENVLDSNLRWIAAGIGHGAEPDLLAVRRLLQHHRPREPGHHESRLLYQGEWTFQLRILLHS